MLSDKANLVNVFKNFESQQEKAKELFFEFHPYFVVTLSAKMSIDTNAQNGGDDIVVVELKDNDLLTELKKMISTYFGGNKDIHLYYHNNGANILIQDKESLEREANVDYLNATDLPMTRPNPPKDNTTCKESHLFISYNWSTKSHVNAVVDKLIRLKPDVNIWRDTEDMKKDIYNSMGSGIAACQIVVACFSMGYLESPNCMLELEFAQDLRKPIIQIFFFEEGYNIKTLRETYSKAFLIIAGKVYSDFKRLDALDPTWETAFNTFLNEVDSALGSNVLAVPKSQIDSWLQPELFDADLEAYSREYVPGTRTWIVADLEAWVLTQERVMYLNGGAGTGKSLIVYSLTRNLPANFVIGALFICRYNNARKSDPIVLVCTIVSSLCQNLGSVFKQHIESEMEQDCARVMDGQQSLLKNAVEAFKTLVVNGLQKLSLLDWAGRILLIVIDALDELNKETRHSVLTILTALSPELPDFVKIVATGRPEKDIYFALKKLSPFVLSPTDTNNTKDIKIFVQYHLQEIWRDFKLQNQEGILRVCDTIVEKAEGLFIYARNVCEYVKKQKMQPIMALRDIETFTSGSDSVYKAILDRELQENRAEKLVMFKHVFAVLFSVQKPLTLTSLANISGLSIQSIRSVILEV
ncbi:hypothetical protein HDU99_003967 [Rhizoclosmatium hyalinum]|nr:hypothetical protein HDU99_003967 [Rhizoclosmatium hyalinum]